MMDIIPKTLVLECQIYLASQKKEDQLIRIVNQQLLEGNEKIVFNHGLCCSDMKSIFEDQKQNLLLIEQNIVDNLKKQGYNVTSQKTYVKSTIAGEIVETEIIL